MVTTFIQKSLFTYILVTIIAFLSGCQTPSKIVLDPPGHVRSQLKRIDVVEATMQSVTLHVVLSVTNDSPYKVNVHNSTTVQIKRPATSQEVLASDAPTTAGLIETGDTWEDAVTQELSIQTLQAEVATTLEAQETQDIAIPVKWSLSSLSIQTREALFNTQAVVTDVTGKVKTNVAEHGFQGEAVFQPPHWPTFKLDKAQLAKTDRGDTSQGSRYEASAFFRFLGTNDNIFSMPMDALVWTITVDGLELKDVGQASEYLPASSTASYETTVDFIEPSFTAAHIQTLLKMKKIPYVIDGYVEIQQARQHFRFQGELHWGN